MNSKDNLKRTNSIEFNKFYYLSPKSKERKK